jgi:hypothetical protein
LTAARHIDGECSANRIKQKTDHPKTPDPPTQFVEEPTIAKLVELEGIERRNKVSERLADHRRQYAGLVDQVG